MKTRTPWSDKLHKKQERKVVEDKRNPGKTLLIPTPLDVDELMRKPRPGELITVNQIRGNLAARFGADNTCPLCTGIFLRIAAEAAEEKNAEGTKDITPYWRTIKGDGSLNEKYPGGASSQAKKLKQEGHELIPGKGKKPPKVANFEKKLLKI